MDKGDALLLPRKHADRQGVEHFLTSLPRAPFVYLLKLRIGCVSSSADRSTPGMLTKASSVYVAPSKFVPEAAEACGQQSKHCEFIDIQFEACVS